MIEVVIALCYVLGAWFYSILRYYDLWKRGKVPVVFFAFLHVFSLIVVFLFETGISAMISDVVSVIMHAYSVIYGSVMILTPIFVFCAWHCSFYRKKSRIQRESIPLFQSSDQIDSWLFCCYHVCRCCYFLEKPVHIVGGDCDFTGE